MLFSLQKVDKHTLLAGQGRASAPSRRTPIFVTDMAKLTIEIICVVLYLV